MSLSELPVPLDTLAAATFHGTLAVTQVEGMLTREAERPALTLDHTHDHEYAPAVTATVEGHIDGQADG